MKKIYLAIIILSLVILAIIATRNPEECIYYPTTENIEKYNLNIESQNYCSACGDGVCDYIEKCLPTSPLTQDCGGGLYCPEDC